MRLVSILVALAAVVLLAPASASAARRDCNFVAIPNSMTFQQVFATNTPCKEARLVARRMFRGTRPLGGWSCYWIQGKSSAPDSPLYCRNTRGRRIHTTGAQDAI
ncbi:MAG: hypothetical protein JWM71_2445 [Solirubrobacteraceae bacterium]|nr:hypothetical protein [Solirubrobacteraceae bacterium]